MGFRMWATERLELLEGAGRADETGHAGDRRVFRNERPNDRIGHEMIGMSP